MQAQTERRNEIVITRVFDGPRELVWKAWTDPELYKQWWGPKNYSGVMYRSDPRAGGKYLSGMIGPDGRKIYSTGTYLEVVPGKKLVMTDSFSDEHGNVVPASQYGLSDEFPMELQVNVTFEDLQGSTMMTLRHEGIPAGQWTKLTAAGWEQSFDKLTELLKLENQAVVE